MYILGIETSCDETAVAVLEIIDSTLCVLSSVVSSQIKTHKPYGGVVPEVAARKHMTNMMPLVSMALEAADVSKHDIGLVAATQGPGLATSLMVGFETGKSLAFALGQPFVAVNHMAGHVFSAVLPHELHERADSFEPQYPFLALLVSGGHTQLVLVLDVGKYKLLGNTRDDAVGEAFDKVARMMQLGYPGGPEVSRHAALGDRQAFDLPRPMLHSQDLDFSFAGLKTAVLYALQKETTTTPGQYPIPVIQDMCASFEAAAIEVLVKKTVRAATEHAVSSVIVAGGVSANSYLRKQLTQAVEASNSVASVLFPAFSYTGDNAAMIAMAGYLEYKHTGATQDYLGLSVKPNMALGNE